MNLDNFKIRSKIFFNVGIVLILMFVISISVLISVNNLQSTAGWVDHTHNVIEDGNKLVAEMVNMETGMRGFLAAGKEVFLEPYHQGKENFFKLMASAQQTVSDNPAQVELLKEIEANANQWLAKAAEPQIALRRKINEGYDTALAFEEIQARVVGKEIFDRMREALKTVDDKFAKESNLQGRYIIQAVTLDLVNMETGQRGFLLTGKEESLEPFEGGQSAFRNHLDELQTFVKSSNGTDVNQEDVYKIQSLLNEWIQKAADPEIKARYEVNEIPATMHDQVELLEKAAGKQFMDGIRADIARFIEVEQGLMENRQSAAETSALVTKLVIVAGAILASVFGILTAFIVARKISNPMEELVAILNLMSKGVVERTIDVKGTDEIAELGISFNRMVENLKSQVNITKTIASGDLTAKVKLASENDLMGQSLSLMTQNLSSTISQLKATANELNVGADQLQESAQTLASGTTQQAASLEEVSSSMTEVEGQTKRNDQNANQAQELSTKSIKTVKKGTAQMDTMIKSMSKINETSAKVSKVIKVIDEIAFQTNLLALNAAVEAARAGTYGKGFAVVAEEVRNLASRSAEAAKDTTNLIEDSLKEVENGVKNVETTAEVLGEIDENVNKVNDLVKEIVIGSNQQAKGISEINLALNQVSNVVQQNSSVSEETASAAEELSSQSTEMARLMNEFKVSTGDYSKPVRDLELTGDSANKTFGEINDEILPVMNHQNQSTITLDDVDYGKY